jgi:diguanylate cyclase (GGDEF)-like protein
MASCGSSPSILVLIIDIGCFKKYNDFLGHIAGDNCIHQIAKGLHESCRRSGEAIARYGGDEFAIILKNTTNNDALKSAYSICNTVLELKVTNLVSHISIFSTLTIKIVYIEEKNTYEKFCRSRTILR